jgi:cell division protein FtsB
MRAIFTILILILLSLQYKFWVGDGNIREWHTLQKKIQAQSAENSSHIALNQELEADIAALRHSDTALEERARYELGMVKDGESYYQFIE